MHNYKFEAEWLVLFIVVLALAGCASVQDRVNGFTESGDYKSALELLNKENAGTVPTSETSSEVLAARDRYATAVESTYVKRISDAAGRGNSRACVDIAHEGLSLCPWSDTLQQEASNRKAVVHQIDQIIDSSESLMFASPNDLRALLLRYRGMGNVFSDSPAANNERHRLCTALLKAWADRIISGHSVFSRINYSDFASDLELAGTPQGDRKRLIAALNMLIELPRNTGLNSSTKLIEIDPCSTFDASAGDKAATKFRALYSALTTSMLNWEDEYLPGILDSDAGNYELMSQAECLVHLRASTISATLATSLAKSHLAIAEARAGDGNSALIAMLHVERAKELDSAITERADQIQGKALASFTGGYRYLATIGIDIATHVDPTVNDLLRLSLAGAIVADAPSYVTWNWVDPVYEQPQVLITVDAASLQVPGIGDLNRVTSSYLSHYEQVPNSRKASLKLQLDLAEIEVDSALTSYNYAVSSFNINPTQWGLINVNSARSQYLIKLNFYNSLVPIYNSTPDTISQAVYLPYSFMEGSVISGWTARGRVAMGGEEESFDITKTDEDFVRFGTKSSDRNEKYRRDDSLDIDISGNHVLEQLTQLSNDVHEKVVQVLLKTIPASKMTPEEASETNWLYLPFDQQDEFAALAGVPEWARHSGRKIKIPEVVVTPPAVALTRINQVPNSETLNATQMHEKHGGHVCQVVSKVPGQDSAVVLGSGALVSPDGYILTCAHVLRGYTCRVRFSIGPAAGEYPAETVFVNERADVALIRAKGLTSPSWLNVRLDTESRSGEPIVAISNPSVGIADMAVDAVTQGLVSTNSTQFWGVDRLVANVSVASGSSGGPLISAETEEIVGVIESVAEPGISKNLASSGYFCLAAPTSRLGAWLGLRYLNKNRVDE